ncbi:MAG: response regulator [Tepidisphaeraceae bacterium]
MIDDSIPLHRIVQASLSARQLELHSAFDGRSGIQLAAAMRPSVILLDLDLPDCSGIEVCRKLKSTSSTAEIPVVFVSAASNPTSKTAAFDAGAKGYITKPFNFDELSLKIAAALMEERQTTQKSRFCPVTRLPNQSSFLADLGVEEQWAIASESWLSCIAIDIDGLRLINRRHGARTGDAVVCHVAQAIRRALPYRGTVYAGEAGTFWVILPGVGITEASRAAPRYP